MFQGYDQQTVDFLWGIRFNNDRSWFQEHKEQYQTHLLAPTRALGEQLYDGLHAMLPHEPLILKVSRIYRDARRLHGQGPYKDHLWLCVRTGDQDWTGRPTFYFEIAPDYYSYGMGMVMLYPIHRYMPLGCISFTPCRSEIVGMQVTDHTPRFESKHSRKMRNRFFKKRKVFPARQLAYILTQ